MKKALSLLLALCMVFGTASVGISAYANDDYDDYDDYYDYDDYDDDNDDFDDDDEDYYYVYNDIEEIEVSQISKTSVKISWEFYWNFYEYDGFEVCQYNTSNDSYKTVATVASKKNAYTYSYTVCNLKRNAKYTFAVRCFENYNGKTYYSDYTEKVSAYTAPDDCSLKSVKYVSQGKVKVRWSAAPKCSGYLLEYSTCDKFPSNGKTCYVKLSSKTTEKTLSGLAKKKYYFRVCALKKFDNSYSCSAYSQTKSCNVKSGCSVKQMLNSIKTDSSGRKGIKKYTHNGVDINKYKTTYDKFRAIYLWHSLHNTDYGWSCYDCNMNFNICLAYLFSNSGKPYDKFIELQEGDFQNNNGSRSMHKWSVIYLAGNAYIFDPRLEGYLNDRKGYIYYGITKGSAVGKKYLYNSTMYFFPTAFENDSMYYDFPFIPSVKRPAAMSFRLTAGKKKATLGWSKVSGAKGYEIQYSTKSDFSGAKTVKVDKGSTVKQTVSGLNSGKKYYFRIRAYKKIGDSFIYGFWSSAKSVTIK